MESPYTPVKTEDNEEDKDKIHWKYVLRQIFIASGPWCIYFVTGLGLGTPTVMIPQLRKEANSTVVVSDDMASWLSSVFGYSSLPWILILPILSEIYGRKFTFNLASIITFIGYVVWYFSTNVTYILIAEIIVSILISYTMALSVVIIVEYTSPKHRGIFLTIKSATCSWGIWVANTIGTFFYWRNIVILSLVCVLYTISSFFWPESPHWLASKGRFEECAKSHRYLKGTSEEAENELKQLIDSQKQILIDPLNHKAQSSCKRLISFFKVFSLKIVYKPVLLSLTVMSMYHLSGKLACNMYAIEILKKITGQVSVAYKGMLILDGVSILGMYFGCYLSKILKRRTLLISCTSFSVLILMVLSLYLYLIKLNYYVDNSYISISLLTLFMISISCGPILLSSSIFAELIPLRYKGSAIISICLINSVVFSTILKISPFLFKSIGIHGIFLFFGISVSICLIIVYKYLPETKDKTLIEIEKYFDN